MIQLFSARSVHLAVLAAGLLAIPPSAFADLVRHRSPEEINAPWLAALKKAGKPCGSISDLTQTSEYGDKDEKRGISVYAVTCASGEKYTISARGTDSLIPRRRGRANNSEPFRVLEIKSVK